MAESVPEVSETFTDTEGQNSSPQAMDLETGDEPNSKRSREEEGDESEKEENGGAKKQEVEKSVEEQRLEEFEGIEVGDAEKEGEVPVILGPKRFGSSVGMFDYFYKFLHSWSTNLNVNKYEHMVLLDLLKKGHLEPEKKIGKGIHAFQVRYHPEWKSRCFFLIRDDESVDDFSFRKCVDNILPLPENMKIKPDVNKVLGGGRGGRFGSSGRGGGRGRGRGRWGRSRN